MSWFNTNRAVRTPRGKSYSCKSPFQVMRTLLQHLFKHNTSKQLKHMIARLYDPFIWRALQVLIFYLFFWFIDFNWFRYGIRKLMVWEPVLIMKKWPTYFLELNTVTQRFKFYLIFFHSTLVSITLVAKNVSYLVRYYWLSYLVNLSV